MSPKQQLKGLPSSPEAERFVLGSIMLDEALMHAARPVLNAEDFSQNRNRIAWQAACAIYDSGSVVDRMTLAQALYDRGEREGLGFACSLDDGLPVAPNLDSYIRILKDKSSFRQIIHAAQHAMNAGFLAHGSPQELLESVSRNLQSLDSGDRAETLLSAKAVIEKHGLEKILSPRKDSGLMFPWPWLNRWTSGMLPAELWILAGYTSTGKTSAVIQHSLAAARRGIGVAIFSLEVGDISLAQKCIYHLAGIDSERAKRGRLMPEERKRVGSAAAELAELPIHFDTTSNTTMAIHAAVRRAKLTKQIDHVIVDYLQLLAPGGRQESRAQAVGNNAWSLKMLATDFKVPVLLLSQFSRKEKTMRDRDPELSDLKESGDIENHANGVWFLHRTNEADADRIPVKFMLPKQREGRRNIYQDFWFLPQYQRFEPATMEEYDD